MGAPASPDRWGCRGEKAWHVLDDPQQKFQTTPLCRTEAVGFSVMRWQIRAQKNRKRTVNCTKFHSNFAAET